MIEKLTDIVIEVLKGLAQLIWAWLGTIGYSTCHLLGVNAIYCDPTPFRIPFFIVVGALLNAPLRRVAIWALGAALVLVIILPIVSYIELLPPRPEWIIEVGLVVPFQLAIGLIVGRILMWLWVHFGHILIAWLRKKK